MSSSTFPIERVVTLLAPLFATAFAALAGWLSTKLGVHVDANTLEGVMAAAFLGTIAIVYKWLHGRQIPEIAGLSLSSSQVDDIREQVNHHLAAIAPAAETNAEEIAQQVIAKLAAGVSTPAPTASVSTGQVTQSQA